MLLYTQEVCRVTVSRFIEALNAYQQGKIQQAIDIWTNLAEAGDVRSQYNLGVLYDAGEVVPQNYWEAAMWFQKAAEQGFADAQFNLSIMYAAGQGVASDMQQSLYWQHQAATQGHPDACYNLAKTLTEGKDVVKDLEQAFFWYEKAADQAHPQAANNLGICYAMGYGVDRNDVAAYKWFNIAVELGDALAVRHRERVAVELGAEQIIEAGRLSSRWLLQKGFGRR